MTNPSIGRKGRHEAYSGRSGFGKACVPAHGVDRSETVVWRRRLRREDWIEVLRERAEPGCEIGMEACGGAHHWARELQRYGYRVKLIAPQFVKPYVKGSKTDAARETCSLSRPGSK